MVWFLSTRRCKPATVQSLSRPRRFRPALETLESRLVPYSATSLHWTLTDVSVSYLPDGTSLNGKPSSLFAHLDTAGPAALWQREFARALQTWANYAPLNFHFVEDDGSASNTWGLIQGDSRFGDIRLGAIPLSGMLAGTIFPSTKGSTQGGTNSGDIILSTSYQFRIGSTYDLYSLLLHEIGHALGLGHASGGTVMYGTYTNTKTGLTADDIAGIQAMYGVRPPDSYDAATANNTLATASSVSISTPTVRFRADLTSKADIDYYRVVAPASSLTVSVDARNLSLLAPKVLVYDSAGTLVASASAAYGEAATLTLSGLVTGQTFTVVADGATSDVFGMGAYILDLAFDASAPAGPPPAPGELNGTASSTSQIHLTWQDRSANETGFEIERSLDGVSFTPAGTAPADATSYFVTGLSTGTTYHFRVRATATEGDSAWSSFLVTTHSAAPDRLESNNSLATATPLGRTSHFSQADLSLHSNSDADAFTFKARKSGRFRIETTFAHSAGNLDLFFYNRAGTLVASSTSLNDDESLTPRLTKDRRYYVSVASPEGDANSFDLSMTKVHSGEAEGQAPLPSRSAHAHKLSTPVVQPDGRDALDATPFAGVPLEEPTVESVQYSCEQAGHDRPATGSRTWPPLPADWVDREREAWPAQVPTARAISLLDEVFGRLFASDEDAPW
jgi:hypothetical protein